MKSFLKHICSVQGRFSLPLSAGNSHALSVHYLCLIFRTEQMLLVPSECARLLCDSTTDFGRCALCSPLSSCMARMLFLGYASTFQRYSRDLVSGRQTVEQTARRLSVGEPGLMQYNTQPIPKEMSFCRRRADALMTAQSGFVRRACSHPHTKAKISKITVRI